MVKATDDQVGAVASPPKVPPELTAPLGRSAAGGATARLDGGLASWQALPDVRRRELVLQIDQLRKDASAKLTADIVDVLLGDLDRVERMLLGPGDAGGLWTGRTLLDWLTGARIRAVWQSLHSVERVLVMHRSAKDLKGSLDGIIAHAKKYLPKDDQSIAQATRWSRVAPKDIGEFRSGVRDLLERAHQASDDFHETVRRLRNGMLGITLLTMASVVALLGVQWRAPSIWLIPAPTNFEGEPWVLLAFVMVAGSLGAFITAVPTTVRARSGGLPYRLPMQQGLLKLAIGPLLAVVGVMFVAGGLVAATEAENVAQLLALAVVFGSAQQALTAFADRTAGDLLASKSSE